MKTVNKTVYICEFCGKKYFRKSSCETHEQRCKSNPKNYRDCFGCKFLVKKDVMISYDTCYLNRNCLYCNKKEVFLIPPIVEHKGNVLDQSGEHVPMPKDCEFQEIDYPM